jgi:hypothetical protein
MIDKIYKSAKKKKKKMAHEMRCFGSKFNAQNRGVMKSVGVHVWKQHIRTEL